MLHRKLKKPYREPSRYGNPASELYASAERSHQMSNMYRDDPSELEDDHNNVVPFTPERDIYTNSIRPYQPHQEVANPISTPRRKKMSLKASTNRRKLDFFADDEDDDEEDDGEDGEDRYGHYGQKGANIEFVDQDYDHMPSLIKP